MIHAAQLTEAIFLAIPGAAKESSASEEPDGAAGLLERVKMLPRVSSLRDIDRARIYLGYTAMPPEWACDQRGRHALFGPFASEAAAEEASALVRRFCHAAGTGLAMGDIFRGDGRKLNNGLVMDVSAYLGGRP